MQRFVSAAFKKFGGVAGIVCCPCSFASSGAWHAHSAESSRCSMLIHPLCAAQDPGTAEASDEAGFDEAMKEVKSVLLFNQSFVRNAMTLGKQQPAPLGGYSVVNVGGVYGKRAGPLFDTTASEARRWLLLQTRRPR